MVYTDSESSCNCSLPVPSIRFVNNDASINESEMFGLPACRSQPHSDTTLLFAWGKETFEKNFKTYSQRERQHGWMELPSLINSAHSSWPRQSLILRAKLRVRDVIRALDSLDFPTERGGICTSCHMTRNDRWGFSLRIPSVAFNQTFSIASGRDRGFSYRQDWQRRR